MKEVALLGAIIVAGLCSIAASIANGDRGTLVPPPDAVAESFTRALSQGNYALAARRLSQPRRASMGRDGLRAWFERFRQRLGRPHRVGAIVESWQDSRSSARASLDAEFGKAVLHLGMSRESGLWVIDELAIAVR